MATVTIRNGINVDQLVATIGAIKENASVATMTFKATTRWQEGTHSVTEIGPFSHAGKADKSRREGQFKLQGDEPPVLLGNKPWTECGGALPGGARLLLFGRLRGQRRGQGLRDRRAVLRGGG